MHLKVYSGQRYQQLDAEQRRRLSANLYVLLSTVPDDVYRGGCRHVAARRNREAPSRLTLDHMSA